MTAKKEIIQIKFIKIIVALFLQNVGTSLIIYLKAIHLFIKDFYL